MESIDKRVLLHAWSLQKQGNEYYIPFTHWIYLKEIVKYYDEVILLSPVKKLKENQQAKGKSIACFEKVTVYALPFTNGGYISALKHFFHYKKAYKEIKDISTYYARYPVPFGWLQKVYGKNSRRIIHYVGDPIDAAKNNPNFSTLKKSVLITGFKLEDSLYNWACKGAEVFTNGHHIAERLSKSNIEATPLISSTLIEADFYFRDKKIEKNNINFIYLGYLRKAKGVETIIKAFNTIQQKQPNSKLSIIGTGEFESELKLLCKEQNIQNVSFFGHIEDRNHINKLLREHDIFLFGSLSEGSPRVILEAMANGLLVLSTPVGSLPKTFNDDTEILFANFNDVKDFSRKIDSIINDDMKYHQIRVRSFEKVKNFTIDNFIKSIFHEN